MLCFFKYSFCAAEQIRRYCENMIQHSLNLCHVNHLSDTFLRAAVFTNQTIKVIHVLFLSMVTLLVIKRNI